MLAANLKTWTAKIPFGFRLGIIGMILAGLQGFFFLGVAYLLNGNLTFPLDDSYIHLQYAKQIARGAYFQYQDGQPPSSGETSFLYAHLLALGYALGFKETGFILWTCLLNGFLAAAVFTLLLRLGYEVNSPRTGDWAAALVFASGVIGWGFCSGMEIALFSTLILWTYYLLLQTPVRFSTLGYALSALVLCRPEGILLSGLIFGGCFLFQPKRREFLRLSYWILVISFFMVLLFLPWWTGSWVSNGLSAKSLWYNPIKSPSEKIALFFNNIFLLGKFLLGSVTFSQNWGEFLPPGLLLFSLIGIIGYVLSQRTESWKSQLTILCAPMLLSSFSIAAIEVWDLHNFRYVLPFIPLLIFWGVYGVEFFFELIRKTIFPINRNFSTTIYVILWLWTVSYLPVWSGRFADNAATIHEKQVQAARWISTNLPTDRPIAVNDAGVLAFYGKHTLFDLVGLVTNGIAIPYRMGEGALYEYLETLPETQRPHYAVVFPSWFKEMAQTYDIFYHPLAAFPDPFDPGFGKNVYHVNWSYAGMEDQPRAGTLRAGWGVRDSLDVASLAGEQTHDYRFRLREKHFPSEAIPFRRNFGYHEEIDRLWPEYTEETERKELIPLLQRQGILNRYDIVDAGRRIDGEESFRMSHLTPGHDAYLILRTCDDTGKHPYFTYRLGVYLNNRFVGEWMAEGTPWNWYEPTFLLPGSQIVGTTVLLRIQNLGTPNFPYYSSYYYWIAQAKEASGY